MRAPVKRFLAGFILIFMMLIGALVFLSWPKPIPPLPFDAKSFVSTTPPTFSPPPNAGVYDRIRFSLFNLMQKHAGTNSTWSFGASPKMDCSVQGLLNQCSEVTGTRYLMSLEVTAGSVQFGNTNTLNGPQWVTAFETALQTSDVEFWDQKLKRMRHEPLVLLRFPAQKTILVLPASEVTEFQRTNGIHMPHGAAK